MKAEQIGLTPAEWRLMESLWEQSPKTGREVAEYLQREVGWTRSTTLTMLRRMTEKGLLSCEEENGLKSYRPLLEREEALTRETEDFLGRVYKGSVSLMMSAITQKQKLSREEIAELLEILQKAEGGAPG